MLFALPSFAAILRVPAQYATIQAAVDSAMDNDTVYVGAGTYREGVRVIGKGLTLASEYLFSHDTLDREVTILTIPDSFRTTAYEQRSPLFVRRSGNFRLVGFTIRDGLGTHYTHPPRLNTTAGGNLMIDSSRVVLEGCRLVGGFAMVGGGLALFDGNLFTYDCVIDSNRGIGPGFSGGGIFSYSDSVYCLRTRFYRNYHQYSAAGCQLQAPLYGAIDSCQFVENEVREYGGGLVAFGDFSCRGNLFYANQSANNSAFIISTQNSETNGVFSGNIVRNNVRNNTSELWGNSGGAFLTSREQTWEIANNIFEGNVNRDSGDGCLLIEFSTFNIHHNQFINNVGGGRNSCIYIMQNAPTTIDSNLFVNNTHGALILNVQARDVQVHHNDFINNSPYITSTLGLTGISDLTDNWWGSSTGPRAATNPDGTGDSVGVGVPFSPWLNAPVFASELRELPREIVLPKHFTIFKIAPNPFNSYTIIRYEIPKSQLVDLTLYDATGKKINTIIHAKLSAGVHQTALDASKLASGTFFVQLSAGGIATSQKLVLLK